MKSFDMVELKAAVETLTASGAEWCNFYLLDAERKAFYLLLELAKASLQEGEK